MSTQQRLQCIYVSLDVLLDTRLGTIARIDDAVAADVIASGTYQTRKNDVFEGVDKAVFDQMYKDRDVETLKLSIVTDAIQYIKRLVSGLTEQAIARPYHDGAKIVVNLYPYNLLIVEQEKIGRAISAWINDMAPVELVFISTKDLTPAHCKDKYSLMMVYEYEEWMETHAEAFHHTRLPEVTMYVPALYKVHTPSVEELEKTVKEAAHPMRALEMLASPIIGLKVIDVKFFSILTKK
jgi:hypothetical protein